MDLELAERRPRRGKRSVVEEPISSGTNAPDGLAMELVVRSNAREI